MFENQSEAELRLEMFEDLLIQREQIIEKLRTFLDPKERMGLKESLQQINEVFDFKGELGDDDLIDEWERDLERGHAPDLGKKPPR